MKSGNIYFPYLPKPLPSGLELRLSRTRHFLTFLGLRMLPLGLMVLGAFIPFLGIGDMPYYFWLALALIPLLALAQLSVAFVVYVCITSSSIEVKRNRWFLSTTQTVDLKEVVSLEVSAPELFLRYERASFKVELKDGSKLDVLAIPMFSSKVETIDKAAEQLAQITNLSLVKKYRLY